MTHPTKLQAGVQVGVWDELLMVNEPLQQLLDGPDAGDVMLMFELLDLGKNCTVSVGFCLSDCRQACTQADQESDRLIDLQTGSG
jgi:hypothetical protein